MKLKPLTKQDIVGVIKGGSALMANLNAPNATIFDWSVHAFIAGSESERAVIYYVASTNLNIFPQNCNSLF